MTVGSNVTSAILTANQAAGGFRAENHAGRRAQIAWNEEDAIEWTKEARAHYRIDVGGAGDGRYLQGWHGPERSGRPFRWSMPWSRLVVPVNPGVSYALTIEAELPKSALAADAGLYLDGKKIVPWTPGTPLTATLPPSSADRLRLELRCQGWVPQKLVSGSQDPRTLGVQAFAVTLRAAGAGTRLFHANTGRWIDTTAAER